MTTVDQRTSSGRGQHGPEKTTAELIGQCPAMHRLREQVGRIARWDVNVLLQGESGTGKELVARAIHRGSDRADGPFIGVNCPAVHETLLESELFGHEAGAFTGATRATPGLFRAAEGGTILLDEVGDMSDALQSKLLRVLEERAVIPVGGTKPRPIDVRVVAATHHDLAQRVRAGRFRRDLFYRLNVVTLYLPPLRQRTGDIALLVEHLAGRLARLFQVPVKTVSPQAMAVLSGYDWPGNVREMANVIQYAYVLGRGSVIEVDDLPPLLHQDEPVAGPQKFPPLRQAIRCHVEQALHLSGGVRKQAATLLGVDRKTLRRMIHRYELA